MMTKTEIANLAIAHLGTGKEIADLETERSQEAAAIRRVWDSAVLTTLRDFAWPFATAYAPLGLVEEFPPNQDHEWNFSYRKPADALTIRKIYSGVRRDAADTSIPYMESSDADGVLILTDLRKAKCEYTRNVGDTSLWPADFDLMMSYKLAYLAVPRLSNGDPFKMSPALQANYFNELSKARANALNEVREGAMLESEFIRSRDY